MLRCQYTKELRDRFLDPNNVTVTDYSNAIMTLNASALASKDKDNADDEEKVALTEKLEKVNKSPNI